jgi:hypothetical protein
VIGRPGDVVECEMMHPQGAGEMSEHVDSQRVPVDADIAVGEGLGPGLGVGEGLERVESTHRDTLVLKMVEHHDGGESRQVGNDSDIADQRARSDGRPRQSHRREPRSG